jgi:hypothetical protein
MVFAHCPTCLAGRWRARRRRVGRPRTFGSPHRCLVLCGSGSIQAFTEPCQPYSVATSRLFLPRPLLALPPTPLLLADLPQYTDHTLTIRQLLKPSHPQYASGSLLYASHQMAFGDSKGYWVPRLARRQQARRADALESMARRTAQRDLLHLLGAQALDTDGFDGITIPAHSLAGGAVLYTILFYTVYVSVSLYHYVLIYSCKVVSLCANLFENKLSICVGRVQKGFQTIWATHRQTRVLQPADPLPNPALHKSVFILVSL